MNEYQYYEFQTIDQSLTDRQMRELRAISSRAAISRTSGDRSSARDTARRERSASAEEAAEREHHLNTLAKRQADAWQRVEAFVATKRPGDYDAAITLLKDLREVGERKGRRVEVTERIRTLREVHAKKSS